VDWAPLTRDLPQYGPVFRLLAGLALPEIRISEDDPEDLKHDAWLYSEAAFDIRGDQAEEDWLAAAQVI